MDKEIPFIDGYKLYENLELLRRNPFIALTSKSITALQNYLTGYLIYGTKGYSKQIYREGDPDFIEFRWWLIDDPSINMHSGPSFHTYLLELCDQDEEAAFDLFFEKLDRFKALKANPNSSASI